MSNAENEVKAASQDTAAATPAAEVKAPEQAAPIAEKSAGGESSRIKEAFVKARMEKRELKRELSELKAKFDKVQTGQSKPSEPEGDDASEPQNTALMAELKELKSQIAKLSKAGVNGDQAKRREEMERAADTMILSDPDIAGAEEIAEVDELIDQSLYARRPDLAVKVALEEWREKKGLSARQKQVSEQALAGSSTGTTTTASVTTGSSKAAIEAKMAAIDPTKPGALAELTALAEALKPK
jgi:seryl-tRNA synthetase